MNFGHMQFLWLLSIIPLLFLFFRWALKRRTTLLNEFVHESLRERLLLSFSPSKQKLKMTMIVMAILFLIVALIRPKWGFHWEEIHRRGVDLLIALDVSQSMMAEDVTPNRLERAKREIIDLLQRVEGDRVGLIAFSGAAFLQSPLTLDYGAVQIFLDEVDPSLIPIPGTALGEAIQMAIKSFDPQDRRSRALILITDGEDQFGTALEAAKVASQNEIRIYTIGIGQETGAPIPDPEGGFKKDRSGNLVLSKLDEEVLQKIALETGGSYVHSVTGDLDLEQIYQDIRKNVEEKDLKSGKQKRFEERYQWPLFVAFLLLLLEPLISQRKKISLLPLLFLGWITLSMTEPLQAKTFSVSQFDGLDAYKKGDYDSALKHFLDAQVEDPDNLKLRFNLADTYYKLGQYQDADKLFDSVAQRDVGDLGKRSLYNLGNSAVQQGKLKEALAFYEEVLKRDPQDEDAKHNLEWVRDEIRRRLEEMKNQAQNQQQSQNQNENSDSNNPSEKESQSESEQNSGKDPQNQQNPEDQKDGSQGEESQGKEAQDKESQGKEAQDKESQDKESQDHETGEDKGKDKGKDQDKKDGQGASEAQDQQQKENPEDPSKPNGDEQEESSQMSRQEAERWLSLSKDDRKKFHQRRARGSRSYKVEKDW